MEQIIMKSAERPLYIRYSGHYLLQTSLLNKGSAFSKAEKKEFNLEGLIPHSIETIEKQVSRAYQQYSTYQHDLEKHVYLRGIQDTNETLYTRLISDHLDEMMPIIYTPTVGKACQLFSQIYRRKRGIFISYPERKQMDEILQNATKRNVKVIVVTDSERILGLGDQGIGGMGIPIGKLALYTACGGISPAYTLPITLDIGTNNQDLLDDPMYMGWKHKRITSEDYFQFLDMFICSIIQRWPKALIQFEDFAQENATPLLKKYQNNICCFNDDIQGTASVTVGTLLAACHAQKSVIKDHKIVFVGAGSAACGIAEQIIAHMIEDGLSEKQALEQVYLTNSKGLLLKDMEHLQDFQMKFSKNRETVANWSDTTNIISLEDVVRESKPSILIGVSGQPGLISESIVKIMYKSCKYPIIMPLSNPTSKVEALPEDIIRWTDGNAIIATGSPFENVKFNGSIYPIAQCNNAYIFPGVGLGVVAINASKITEKMFMVASETLANNSPLVKGTGNELLPPLKQIRNVSKEIAIAVANQALEENVAVNDEESCLFDLVEKNFWEPEYREYRRTSL